MAAFKDTPDCPLLSKTQRLPTLKLQPKRLGKRFRDPARINSLFNGLPLKPQCIEQQSKRRCGLPPAGIIKVEPVERIAPILQHTG